MYEKLLDQTKKGIQSKLNAQLYQLKSKIQELKSLVHKQK